MKNAKCISNWCSLGLLFRQQEFEMKIVQAFFGVLIIMSIALSGCGKHNGQGVPTIGNEQPTLSKLSDSEVERRIRDYSLDLDTAANLGELFTAISEGLGVEIVIESERISPETAVSLKNSKESFIVQILETVAASTGTRYEVRKGKIWIKDAN
jgi:hypothetical protein